MPTGASNAPREVPWALCWFIPSSQMSAGINKTPPPIPTMPETTPTTRPTNEIAQVMFPPQFAPTAKNRACQFSVNHGPDSRRVQLTGLASVQPSEIRFPGFRCGCFGIHLPRLERRPELDALRGLFLVWMTLTHLPTRFSDYLNQPIGFVSSAEGFVFISALLVGRLSIHEMMEIGRA